MLRLNAALFWMITALIGGWCSLIFLLSYTALNRVNTALEHFVLLMTVFMLMGKNRMQYFPQEIEPRVFTELCTSTHLATTPTVVVSRRSFINSLWARLSIDLVMECRPNIRKAKPISMSARWYARVMGCAQAWNRRAPSACTNTPRYAPDVHQCL